MFVVFAFSAKTEALVRVDMKIDMKVDFLRYTDRLGICLFYLLFDREKNQVLCALKVLIVHMRIIYLQMGTAIRYDTTSNFPRFLVPYIFTY